MTVAALVVAIVALFMACIAVGATIAIIQELRRR